jgi:hypothetical protein
MKIKIKMKKKIVKITELRLYIEWSVSFSPKDQT